MEEVNYTTAIIWYAVWPVVIYVSYKFVWMNIKHLEDNLEPRSKNKSS